MNDELVKLKEELSILKRIVDEKIHSIESRIAALENVPFEDSDSGKQVNQAETIAASSASVPIAAYSAIDDIENQLNNKNQKPVTNSTKQERQSSKKWIMESLSVIAASLLSLPLIGTLFQFTGKLKDLYIHYKKQGKLPVLFLTVAGIVTLVAGFGYLLQYSFAHFLNNVGKVIIGFISALIIIATGIRIIGKGKSFREFGSSLIGLGIIINYLCIYFSSSYFGFLSPGSGFILILINTVIAYTLALKYETRVVSVISFLGGAFTPTFLGSSGESSIFYFSFLLTLCISMVHLARKIEWPTLVHLSFIIAGAIIESFILRGSDTLTVNYLMIMIHIFSYTYIYYSFFDRLAFKRTLHKTDIIILTGAIGFLLINLYMVQKNQVFLGLLYSANALVFLVPGLIPNRIVQLRATLLLFAGAFLGLAIPAFTSLNIVSLFWAQECIALLLLGFLYNLPSVRIEAYTISFIVFISSVINLPVIVEEWDISLFNTGTLNLLILGILFLVIIFIFSRFKEMHSKYENKLLTLYNELLSLWIFTAFIITSLYLIPEFAFIFAVIPMFFFLYHGSRNNLRFTRFLGLASYLLIIIQISISAVGAGTLRFRPQTIYGKISMIEAFLILWGTQLFYEKLFPDSRWFNFAEQARTLFYICLPLVFLSHVWHYHQQWFVLALWGSFIIAFILSEAVKRPVLLSETMLILISAIFAGIAFNFMKVDKELFSIEFISLWSGLLILSGAVLWKSYFRKSESFESLFGFLENSIFIYLGLCIFTTVWIITSSISLSLLFTGIYLVALILFRNKLVPVKSFLNYYYRTGQFLIVSGLLANLYNIFYNIEKLSITQITLFLFVTAILCRHSHFDKELHIDLSKNNKNRATFENIFDLYFFHFILAAIYLIAIHRITGLWMGPATTVVFVLHSIFLLFFTTILNLRGLIALYVTGFAIVTLKIVFYDLRDFSLFQKVLAFIVIGVVMLFAAYGMQRYVSFLRKEET